MFRKSKVCTALAVAFGGTAMLSLPAIAQTSPPAAEAQSAEIVISGSRIKRDNFSSVSPLQIIRNVGGIVVKPDHSQPSPQLEKMVKLDLASGAVRPGVKV